MLATITPTSGQVALAQDTPTSSNSVSYRLLDDVDIIETMSTLRDLIGHPITPTIITKQFAPTPRRDGFSRQRITHHHSLSFAKLQPRTITSINRGRKASRPTSKRFDRRQSRTYWPVWYQKQRRRERKEAARNMKLDEQRRLELMELWEDEFFQILMYLLTEHLKRAVLALALELRREMERLDEIELELLNEMEDLG
ncbi:hypothetical protein NEUTE2DRAFT_72988 [Neurospora tetrasperma FGSC 2509]|nr:hypothetical protein NEUTE2DRAFT_72988 [Neurospora tetrasperma FGSC 2509]